MTTLGGVPLTCPVCEAALLVPITATSPEPERHTHATGHIVCTFAIDWDYLAAHWLTHDQHDGEPIAA